MDFNKINEKLNQFSEKLNQIGESVSSGLNQGFSSFDSTLNKGIDMIDEKLDNYVKEKGIGEEEKEIYTSTEFNDSDNIPANGLGTENNVVVDNVIKPAVGVKLNKESDIPKEYQSINSGVCEPQSVSVSVLEPVIKNTVNLDKN